MSNLPPLKKMPWLTKDEAELTAVALERSIWFHEIPKGHVLYCASDGTFYPDPIPDPIEGYELALMGCTEENSNSAG